MYSLQTDISLINNVLIVIYENNFINYNFNEDKFFI